MAWSPLDTARERTERAAAVSCGYNRGRQTQREKKAGGGDTDGGLSERYLQSCPPPDIMTEH